MGYLCDCRYASSSINFRGGPGMFHHFGGDGNPGGGPRGRNGLGGGIGTNNSGSNGGGGGGGGWKGDGNCTLYPSWSRACGMGFPSLFVGGQALCDGCRMGGLVLYTTPPQKKNKK